MSRFASAFGCHPDTMQAAAPIFQIKNLLAAPHQAALDLVINRNPVNLIFFIAQAAIVGISASDKAEQQNGYRNIISCTRLSSSASTSQDMLAILHALNELLEQGSKDPSFQKALVDIVVRFHDSSLVTGNPILAAEQTLPFLSQKDGTYLDLACGPLAPRYIGEQFKNSGNTCVFLDNAPTVIDIAREYAKRVGLSSKVTATCADVCDAPKLFERESFDVIHFRQPFSCFEHRERPLSDLDIPALLELIKPGGYFVLGYTLVGEAIGVIPLPNASKFVEIVNDEFLNKIVEMLKAGLGWSYNYGSWLPTGEFVRGAIAFTNPTNRMAPEACFVIRKP